MQRLPPHVCAEGARAILFPKHRNVLRALNAHLNTCTVCTPSALAGLLAESAVSERARNASPLPVSVAVTMILAARNRLANGAAAGT